MNIKICINNYYLGVDKGGGNIHIHYFLKNAVKTEHEITFISNENPKIHGIKFCQYEINKNSRLGRFLFSYYSLKKIKELEKNERFDIIYTRSLIHSFLFLLGHISETPVVLEVNGIWSEEYITRKSKSKRDLRYFIIKCIEKFVFERIDAIICVTPEIKEHYKKTSSRETLFYVVQNGVDPEVFREIDVKDLRKDMGFEGKKIICFVGKFEAWQGIYLLLDAFVTITDEYPNVELLVIGGGSGFDEYKRRVDELKISQNVHFIGHIPHSDVPRYINLANVCVAPFSLVRTVTGSSGLKLFEYMACNKPVVVTNVPNVNFISEKDLGIVVNENDPAELASAIITMLKDEEKAGKMGKKGGDYVRKYHSWDKIVERTLNIFEEICIQRNDI